MSETEAASDPALDKVPVVKPQAVSQPGDLWLLGNSQRLLGADATEPKSYLKFKGGEVAAASIGDPPSNVSITGNVSGNGKSKHEKLVMG